MIENSIPIVTYYLLGLLFNAVISLGIAVKSLRMRHKPGNLWLGLFMLAVAWWSLALFGGFYVTTLPAKIFWAKMEYIGSMSALVGLLFFALEFGNMPQYFRYPYGLLYLLVPALSVLLAWSNEYHQLIWTSFTWVDIPGSNAVLFGHGPFFWVMIGYVYLCLAVVTILFLRTVLTYRHIHRRQAAIMVTAMLAPWSANILYIADAGLVPGWDLTPFGFAVSGALLAFSINRWGFLDLAPIARDRVIEEMQQGVVVLDDQQRIIDLNSAACALLDTTPAVIGQHLAQVAPLCQAIPATADMSTEIEWPEPTPRTLRVSNSPLLNQRQQLVGYLLTCRDITAEKQAQREIWEQQLAVAVLEERQQLSNQLHTETGRILKQVVGVTRSVIDLLEKEHNAAAVTVLSQLGDLAYLGGVDINEFIHSSQPAPDFFPALRRYIHHFRHTYNLPVKLTHPSQPADQLLSPLGQIQLLRSLQEILLYIAQEMPGEPTRVIISYHQSQVQTVISKMVSPDRNPIDAQLLLSLVMPRLEPLGGVVEIFTEPGQEEQIIIDLPGPPTLPTDPVSSIRVVLVDDHQLLLKGFTELLQMQGIDVVGVAANGPEAIEQARRLQPDIVLMDLRLPGMSGLEATRLIKAEFPGIKVVLLTVSQEAEDMFEALRSGANGYLLKTMEPNEFLNTLTDVMKGDTPIAPDMVDLLMNDISRDDGSAGLLSNQQRDILRLVVQGLTYREIGERLFLAERTVQYHMAQIRVKLNASSRAEAVAVATRLGLAPQSD